MKSTKFFFTGFLTVILLLGHFPCIPSADTTGDHVAQADYTPTHKTEIDLWIRNDVPNYSFRTGEWILGKKIGVINKNTEFQALNQRTIGFTQIWLEIRFKLPDGRIVGGRGYWIWAGRVDTMENVTALSPQGNKQNNKSLLSFSFVKEAYAKSDSAPPPGLKSQLFDPDEFQETTEEVDDSREIIDQLNSLPVFFLKYSMLYLALLAGIVVGSSWDWLNLRTSEIESVKSKYFYKVVLRTFIGSLISFSFFIGPIMGIGEIGFSFSSAILAFHFGLVHYDPTELVYSLRKRYAVSG
jgi:hypothetical protein